MADRKEHKTPVLPRFELQLGALPQSAVLPALHTGSAHVHRETYLEQRHDRSRGWYISCRAGRIQTIPTLLASI